MARAVSPWNPANAVTASRYLFLPLLWWAIAHGLHQWATLLIIVCGLIDKLDGLVARIFDCRSAFGELFDALPRHEQRGEDDRGHGRAEQNLAFRRQRDMQLPQPFEHQRLILSEARSTPTIDQPLRLHFCGLR